MLWACSYLFVGVGVCLCGSPDGSTVEIWSKDIENFGTWSKGEWLEEDWLGGYRRVAERMDDSTGGENKTDGWNDVE